MIPGERSQAVVKMPDFPMKLSRNSTLPGEVK